MFRNASAMIETIRNYSQGKGLNLRKGLFTGLLVGYDPRQIGHLGHPGAIIFTLKFNPYDFILPIQVYLRPKR